MRDAATIERSVVLSGVEKRRALVSQAKARWGDGQAPDAKAVLEQHPELVDDRNAVVDLVFEEFALRRQAGEKLDPVEFADRFSRYKTSLRKVLMMHECMEVNPHLLPVGDVDGWPAPGETLLGFDIIGELGRGAFARVYLATQPSLGNRRVAIKISRRGGGAEAHILGQVQHDHIVPVHSVQEDSLTGWTIVCMPYFGKATLDDVLDLAFADEKKIPTRGRVILDAARPPEGLEPSVSLKAPSATLQNGSYVDAVVEIGVQLAEALAFAHGRKIYHRDLKPSNVLVGPDGRARILDFNLSFDAKANKELLGGTLIYMPPEQLRATDEQYTGPPELLEAPSDIYSLGVILFELLTGKHPFGPIPWKLPQHKVRRELLDRQERGPADLRKLNPGVDRTLAEVITRCLAWKAEDRFTSAEQFAEALRPCLKSAPARSSRVRNWLIAALLVLTTGGVAAYYGNRVSAREGGYEAGLEAYRKGQFDSAQRLLTPAIDRKEELPKNLFLRGRVWMRMGEWEAARDDFLRADREQPDGRTKAALAYCYSRGSRPDWTLAYLYYQEAIDNGFENAIVRNNLADCCMPTKIKDRESTKIQSKLEEAFQHLDRAYRLDPKLQVVYHNIVLADIHMAVVVKGHIPRRGIAAADEAVKLRPVSGYLYRDCALVYALASREPLAPDGWKEKALGFARKAVEHGFPWMDLQRDPLMTSLLGSEPAFLQAQGLSAETSPGPRPSLTLDPLGEQ